MVSPVVDHSGQFGQARDQGRRPTCIVFAISDGHAFFRKSPDELLSPEYLFYKAAERQRPDHHYDGVKTVAVEQALSEDGQPLEDHYPYLTHLSAKADLPVPDEPFPHPRHRAKWIYQSFSPDLVAQLVSAGESILLILKITDAFRRVKTGQAVLRLEELDLDNDPVAGIHAVVGVGYGLDKSGESYVRIRNSWGHRWAADGYVWLPMKYLAKHLAWMAKFG